MQKDYLPVSEKGSSLSETAFIEDFWSLKWDQQTFPTDLAQRIEQREKGFKVPDEALKITDEVEK